MKTCYYLQRSLIIAVCLLLTSHYGNAQHPGGAQNYSSELLRLAKAAHIKAYMNEDKQPCENFYKFACGDWHRLHPALESGSQTNYLNQLQELYARKSADMLKEQRRTDTSADLLLKNFYESCRAEAHDNEAELDAILNVVDFQGGWPIVKTPSWYEYEYKWLDVVANLKRKLGVDILIGLDIVPDYVDKNIHRIKVGAPKLELGTRNIYLTEKYAEKRKRYTYRIAHKLRSYFPRMSENWADEVAAQVLDMEQQLAEGLPQNPALTLRQTTRQRTANELKAAYGSFVDLSRYLNLIFNESLYVQVYESPEDYMTNLVEVIRNTPKMVIANYTMWRVLERFDAARVPPHEQPDIWCVHKVDKYFPRQLETQFHRNFNNMQMINEVQSTWADVKRVFRESLQASEQLHWLSLETRQKAIVKLDALELQFRMHDERSLINQLHGLVLRPTNYYQNLLNVLQWQTKQLLSKVIETPASDEEDIKLPKYQLTTNRIQVPITFLQARFFWDPAYPSALKYGTLGYLLAQEMLHGFDMIGRKYDKYGYQNNWWDSDSEKAFNERIKCLEKQYSVYHQYKDRIVRDEHVLPKSIADNGALGIAYRAYLKWWKNIADSEANSKEALPLLDYTQYQLFFIGYAQLWCADYADSIEIFTELPARLRVNAVLSNSPDFANEYKCSEDSKLNPREKCSLY